MNNDAMANPMKTIAPSNVTFRTDIFLAIKAPQRTKINSQIYLFNIEIDNDDIYKQK